MMDVFISYARADDEPFVKRLYEDLTANGFEVWWDRVSMPSRDLTFLQEIRDAIAERDRLILVVGPEAMQSEYVRAEWEYMLSICKGVLPVLRLGDYDLLPPELDKRHCVDMRESRPYKEALKELLDKLDDPVAKPGALYGVPSLPAHYLPRPDHLATLSESVLTDVNLPTVITSAQQTTALQGMGGVGKSVLVAAFARSCETRRAVQNGVIWLTVGRAPNVRLLFEQAGRALGDSPQNYPDEGTGKQSLQKLLADRVCLLVLDDVWDVKHAEPFHSAIAETRCRLLITTRDGGLAKALGAQEQRVDVLGDEAALELLADWARMSVEALPPEAREVADECGNLPFALALCGAMARDGIPWDDLLDALHEADLSFIEEQLPGYPYPDILRALGVSVDVLGEAERKHYHELAAFPEDIAVPEEAVYMLWLHTDGLNERSARKLLTTLERKALLRLEGEAPQRRVSLHDLQHDYLRAAQGDLTSLHGGLLEAYCQKCPDGWPTGPDDGYFFEQLAYHLVEARRGEELRELLLDFDWLQAKLNATDVNALIADYDFLPDDADLRLVQGAIRLSAHVLAQDKAQLAGQLLSRLMTQQSLGIQAMLERAKGWKAAPWLCPLTLSLTPPGGSLLRTLSGHSGHVNAVALMPDGQRAISASEDYTLKMWDLESGQELRTFQGHSNTVEAVAVTPDGRLAISASRDGTLKVWDLESGQELRTIQGHPDIIEAVALTPDGQRAISASWDCTLKVWDLESGQELRTLLGHSSFVNAVAVSPDGRHAISAARDNTLKVWDLESGQELRTMQGHSDFVTDVMVTPNGRYAISTSLDNTLKVWDLGSGEELRTLQGHSSWVLAVTVTPDGRHAISAARDNTLKVWDLASGRELRTLRGHSKPIDDVTVTPDGRFAISASVDTTLKVWDLDRGQERSILQGHSEEVTAVTVTPDGRFAISASADTTLRVWDLDRGQERSILQGHSEEVTAVTVTPNGRFAISASADTTLKVWDLDRGQECHTLQGHFDRVEAVAVTPDGRFAISASADTTLKVWDLDRGQEGQTLQGHFDRVTAVVVTPDGRFAISGSWDHSLRVWDIHTGEGSRTPLGNLHELIFSHAVAITPNGRFVISASIDDILMIWDLANGGERCFLDGHSDHITAVAVTPDGRSVISTSWDNTLKVWDLESGQLLRTLQGHSNYVNDVLVTRDGRFAISTSRDATLKMWDLDRGRMFASFSGEGSMNVCTVTPDDQTFIAGDAYGQVHFLRLEGVE